MIIKNVFMEEKVDDELIIMDSSQTNILTLNSVATVIWKLLDETKDFDSLLKKMKKKYPDVDEKTLSSDLDELITQFVNMGVLIIDE